MEIGCNIRLHIFTTECTISCYVGACGARSKINSYCVMYYSYYIMCRVLVISLIFDYIGMAVYNFSLLFLLFGGFHNTSIFVS